MPFFDLGSDGKSFFGEDQASVLFVVEIAEFPEFLDHASDRGLLDLQRGSDIHHAGITFLPDQLMDSFQVILGTLAG